MLPWNDMCFRFDKAAYVTGMDLYRVEFVLFSKYPMTSFCTCVELFKVNFPIQAINAGTASVFVAENGWLWRLDFYSDCE